MSNKKQTAISELIKEMESLIDKPYINPKNALNDCIHLAYAKLEMEHKQIIDAVVWFDDTDRRPTEIEKQVNHYISETYGE